MIGATHRRISQILEELIGKRSIDDYEMIFVDDGSRDGSLNVLKHLAKSSPHCKVLSFSRNFGHQAALAAGILYSAGDAVVSLDADLQDPPELIGEMIEKYRNGNDIVYAVRRAREHDTLFKRATARLFYRVMRAMGADLMYDHADFRLISRKVVEAFMQMKEVNIFLRGIFPYMGFSHDIVHYERHERLAGETKYPLRRMIAFAWEGITSFSTVPLRVASVVGGIMSLFSLLLIVWAFVVKLSGKAIPGWSSTVIPLFFIGGLNILFLGLVGEYIGKIYLEVKRRPIFLIKESYNVDPRLPGD